MFPGHFSCPLSKSKPRKDYRPNIFRVVHAIMLVPSNRRILPETYKYHLRFTW